MWWQTPNTSSRLLINAIFLSRAFIKSIIELEIPERIPLHFQRSSNFEEKVVVQLVELLFEYIITQKVKWVFHLFICIMILSKNGFYLISVVMRIISFIQRSPMNYYACYRLNYIHPMDNTLEDHLYSMIWYWGRKQSVQNLHQGIFNNMNHDDIA